MMCMLCTALRHAVLCRYVEASKARLYSANLSSISSCDDPDAGGGAVTSNPHAAQVTRAVLVYTFDSLLRLVHPFMPYISEELWQVRGKFKHQAQHECGNR